MVKNRLHKLAAILLLGMLIALAPSCKKNIQGITPPGQYGDTSFNQVFQSFWSGMNTNYVYWGIDTTNWDNVYLKYQPLFAKLNINDSVDVVQGYKYFQEMTLGLVDCHYNLGFYSPYLQNLPAISPAGERKTHLSPALSFAFFSGINKPLFDTVYSCYSPFQSTFAGKSHTSYMGIVTGIIQQHIVYLHLNQFALQYLINQSFDSVATAWNMFITNAHNASIATQGIIIDLRNNNGGYIEDLDFICGAMIDKPLSFAYTREKSGNGRLDYTPWANAIVTPNPGATAITIPIVVLTDQHSVSMAEMTTMALKMLPNTYVIGDTTWGATGPLDTDDGLYGGGQFAFANFGYVYTSSAMYKYWNGEIYENKGFPPDKYVPYNADSVLFGKDVQLDAAISYLAH